MKITEEDLIEQYESLPTEELIELYAKNELTELASSVLVQILKERGISPENLSKPVAKEANEQQTYHEDRIKPLLDKEKKATARKGGTPYKRFLQIILLITGFAVASKLWGLQHAIGLFIFLMIHEYGHVAAMKMYGVPVHGIFVLPFIGAAAISKDESTNLWHRFMIAYMGPVFGALVTLIGLVALFTVGDITFLQKFVILCAAVSIFNLLPLGILDGGRIVMSIAFSIHFVMGYLVSIGTVLLCVGAALLMKLWFLWIVAYVAFMEMISNIRKKGLGSRLEVAKRMSVRQILSAIALYIGLFLFFIVVVVIVTQAFPDADEAFNRGFNYHADGHYEKAIFEYNKAIKINPQHAMAYNNRGIVYESKGQYDKAISDFSKALEIDPKLANAYVNRGSLMNKLGNTKMACYDWTRLCELGDCYYYENAKRDGDCE